MLERILSGKSLKGSWEISLYDYHEREKSGVMIVRSSDVTPEKARLDNFHPEKCVKRVRRCEKGNDSNSCTFKILSFNLLFSFNTIQTLVEMSSHPFASYEIAFAPNIV